MFNLICEVFKINRYHNLVAIQTGRSQISSKLSTENRIAFFSSHICKNNTSLSKTLHIHRQRMTTTKKGKKRRQLCRSNSQPLILQKIYAEFSEHKTSFLVVCIVLKLKQSYKYLKSFHQPLKIVLWFFFILS